MSDELYLIAHKVRGEPAFDIAQHMTCPKCEGKTDEPANADWEHQYSCDACDDQGHWWIIPTSGHRAWPVMNWPLVELERNDGMDYDHGPSVLVEAGPLAMHPEFMLVRDHYTTTTEAALDLTKALGLTAKPQPPILRRL